MGLFTRPKTYTTPVRKLSTGYAFDMSPGVTVLIQPHAGETEEFARKLAEVIQRVAHEEWE